MGFVQLKRQSVWIGEEGESPARVLICTDWLNQHPLQLKLMLCRRDIFDDECEVTKALSFRI